jgi:hypothetical protein
MKELFLIYEELKRNGGSCAKARILGRDSRN